MKAKLSVWVIMFLFISQALYAQTGKYFTASSEKCKSLQVFIDYRIQQYCGTDFTAEWTGGCKDGFADGEGLLTIRSKKEDRTFTLKYEGRLIKGKKEGKGTQFLFHFDLQNEPMYKYAAIAPYYLYKGNFKNDEFDGYGEFKSDYPYPVDPDDIGKGVSMERLGLDLAIWRSDLFFYEYNGNFSGGKIADAQSISGRTKKMPWVGKLTEYQGDVRNGRPNGKGKATEVSIIAVAVGQFWCSTEGTFVNGKLNGYGKEVKRYSVYEGEFVNGIREGKGKLTVYRQGTYDEHQKLGNIISYIVDCNFKKGSAEDFATIYFQNSAAYKYTGPLKNGDFEGTGEIEFLDGAKLRGNFKNGMMEGEGAITFTNGDKFSGMYADNKPVRGTLYYSNGAKYEGEMSIREETNKTTGKPVQVYIRQGNGVQTDKDGASYNVKCTNDNCTRTD